METPGRFEETRVSGKPAETKATTKPADAAPANAAPLRWRDVWQAPVMLVAGGLLVAGVAMSLLNAPKPNFADMLDQAEHKLKDEHVAEALEQLNKEIAPYVAAEDLPRELVQRFHVLRARAVYIGEAKNDHSQANGNEGHAAPAEDRLGAPAHVHHDRFQRTQWRAGFRP